MEQLKDHQSNSHRKNNRVEFLTDFDDRRSVFIDFLKNISKKISSFANWKKYIRYLYQQKRNWHLDPIQRLSHFNDIFL